VIRSGERNLVFVALSSGKFEPRRVLIGTEGGPNNRYVNVLDGLLEEERIVKSAQFMLDSESRLQEAIEKMLNDRMGKSESIGISEQDNQKSIQEEKSGHMH
jgi:hypothetical protein